MNRKNTILIAVLINAGLLVVLLISALTSPEQVSPGTPMVGDAIQRHPIYEDKPLFSDAIDFNLKNAQEAPVAITLPELKPVEVASNLSEESPVHKLPPLVSETVPVVSAPPPAVIARSPYSEVTVKKGDNLEKIAKIYHTTVDEIIKINHLPSSFLRIGQVLKIPVERSLANAPKPKSAATEKRAVDATGDYYIVKVGDNPWTIAMKHQMKVDELLRLNGLNEEKARKLKPGDRLRVR